VSWWCSSRDVLAWVFRYKEDEFASALAGGAAGVKVAAVEGEGGLTTWQARSLVFQEGMVATAIVCGLVLFELLYVAGLADEGAKFLWGLAISAVFFGELCLRV